MLQVALPPHTSAKVIINHVTDGEAIARQYKLPQPIIDGITMHHGSGLIQYFYAKALEQAEPGDEVDEADFRYPGAPPDSRETGIMMLADKVEAACRTLKDKSPDSIRGLIQKIVNGAIMDGQLERCPLTVKELYTIVEAFTSTLLGIYHHRIEYPGIPKRSPAARSEEAPTGPIITLEMATNPLGTGDTTDPSGLAAGPASYTDPNLGRVEPSDPGIPRPPNLAVSDPRIVTGPDPSASSRAADYESADYIGAAKQWAGEDDR